MRGLLVSKNVRILAEFSIVILFKPLSEIGVRQGEIVVVVQGGEDASLVFFCVERDWTGLSSSCQKREKRRRGGELIRIIEQMNDE